MLDICKYESNVYEITSTKWVLCKEVTLSVAQYDWFKRPKMFTNIKDVLFICAGSGIVKKKGFVVD